MSYTNQPSARRAINTIPSGLDSLLPLDQVLIEQEVKLAEVFTGCEFRNKYKIKNTMQQEIFKVHEDSGCLSRQLCGPMREFAIFVKDPNEVPIIEISRGLSCQGPLFPCCLQELHIKHSPTGEELGRVRQVFTWTAPKFEILDANGSIIFTMHGPCCSCSCGADVAYPILTPDSSTEVGTVTKKFTGFVKEVFTDADTFSVKFPATADVKTKAICLGAAFLIDFMYFERK